MPTMTTKLWLSKDCEGCRYEKRPSVTLVRFCDACERRFVEYDRRAEGMTLEDFIREVVNGRMDISDCRKHNVTLYEQYMVEMPYGTAKARDGDPDQWMFDRLCIDYSHLIEEESA